MSLRSLLGLAGALLLAACGSSSTTAPDSGTLSTQFSLQLRRTGSGAGSVFSAPTGISCGSTCTANFGEGSQVTLNPLARVGSIFTGWSGDCTGSAATCVVTMGGNKSVQANFEILTHPVAVTFAGAGSGEVTSDPQGLDCTGGTCSASFVDGARVTLTATGAEGSAFASWSGDCQGVNAAVCTVTADKARNVGVSFSLTAAKLSVTVNGNGEGTVASSPAGIEGCSATAGTCSALFTPGAEVTLTATPGLNSTAHFDGCDSASGNSCTVTVSTATTVTLTYSRPQIPLTVSVNGNGGGTVDSDLQGITGCSATGGTCSASFGQGLDVTLTATPDVSSQVSWAGCTSSSGNTCTVTMDAAASVTAGFNHVNHDLTVNVTGTGTVSEANLSCSGASCTGNYLQGTPITLTATPGAGKTVTWTGCDSASGNSCTVALAADQTVSASFNMTLLSITPADGSTSVPNTSAVVLTFSSPIDSATASINTACNGTVELSAAGGSLSSGCRSATVAVSGNQVTITPNNNLTFAKLFKAKATTALKDTAGDGLVADFVSAGFTTDTTWSVSSTAPSDTATDVPVTTGIAVTFNHSASSVTAQATDGACSGSFQVTANSSFTNCLGGTLATADNVTWTFTPAAPLNPGSLYKFRITPAARDTNQNGLTSNFNASFTTSAGAGFVVSSTSPADGATQVSTGASIGVTFSAAATVATITTNSADTSCSGSLQVSSDGFATCVQMAAAPISTDGDATFTVTPLAALANGTTYEVRVTTAAQSAGGTALAADFTTATGFQTAVEVSNVTAANVALQSAEIDWTAPAVTPASYKVYVRPQGSPDWSFAGQTTDGSQTRLSVSQLAPETAYDVQVTTVDPNNSNESPCGIALCQGTVTTALTGTLADFDPAQKVDGYYGRDFYLTWNGTHFYAAIAKGGEAFALDGTLQNAFWIVFDTDPAGDANGTAVLTGPSCSGNVFGLDCYGNTDVTFPFKADVAVELKNASGTAEVSQWTAGGAWTPSGTATGTVANDGSFAEVKFAKADIGAPAQARAVFVGINPANGNTFDLAPKSATATDVLGSFSSLTSGLDLGTSIFDATKSAASVSGATSFDAPGLVTLSVDAAGATLPGAQPGIFGDRHPLLFRDGFNVYTLAKSGSVYTGTFNFGQAAGSLYFEFTDGQGNPETHFGAGLDRVFTLSGATEAAPALNWGEAYSATHVVTLEFTVSTGSPPTNITGALPELGSFGCGTGDLGLALTDTGTADANGELWSATTTVTNHDFNASPVNFKVLYGACNYEGGSDHSIHSDVLNELNMKWNAGDSASF